MALYCIYCGKSLPEGARFCIYCGTPVPAELQQQQHQVQQPAPQPSSYAPDANSQPIYGTYDSSGVATPQQQPSKKKSNGAVIALIIILALAAMGGGAWALYKYVLKPKFENITDPISEDEEESEHVSFSTDESDLDESDQAEDFTGFFDQESEETDDEEEEYIEEECSRCNGTGEVRCTRCKGKGYYYFHITEDGIAGCTKCGGADQCNAWEPDALSYIRIGSGHMTCPSCHGRGR